MQLVEKEQQQLRQFRLQDHWQKACQREKLQLQFCQERETRIQFIQASELRFHDEKEEHVENEVEQIFEEESSRIHSK